MQPDAPVPSLQNPLAATYLLIKGSIEKSSNYIYVRPLCTDIAAVTSLEQQDRMSHHSLFSSLV